jgi:exodeoxyribonuclease V beta subunit
MNPRTDPGRGVAPDGGAIPLQDPADLPLFGSRLIEASAGTGKTFTIAALYLRLVLGHGGERAFAEPLLPPCILVVTFTDAATRELRARIHDRLLDAARRFRGEGAGGPDPVLQRLLDDYPEPADRARCARQLEVAAEWMDEAAVSTIHSWCYRMLREHAFDSGSLFEQQLETDLSELREEAVRDYWRHMVYPQQGARLTLLLTILGPDPGALDGKMRGLLATETPRAAPVAELNALLDRRLAGLETVKAPWRDDFDAVAASFREAFPALNGGQYRNVDGLLEDMREWARDPCRVMPGDPKKALAVRFSRGGMGERLKKGQVLPADLHLAFARLDGYADAVDDTPAAVLCHAAAWVRDRFEREQRRRAQLGFDDLLTGLDDALAGPGGARLADTIRRQFPVAMIDEFQDTDPVQYRIFERIYRVPENRPEQGVFLIGDPKQSIYSFRGADIHSYLRARRATAGRHYTLTRNFRASHAMVAACNRVFQHAEGHADGAFLFRSAEGLNPVPFQPVEAQGQPQVLRVDGRELPALILAHLDDAGSIATAGYLEQMAARAASVMVSLLEAGRTGAAGFAGGAGSRDLRAADLAVLVRDRHEARAIRAALRRRGVRSVYMSDRESVFGTPEAVDVLRWLRACAEPESDRLLRAALATATLDLGLDALDRLNSDEAHWEERVLQFREYRRIWRDQSVLPMLHRLLHEFALPGALFHRDDGERVLTNLLHLSELLQTAAAELDGEQALIRHLAGQVQEPGAAGDEQILRLESDEGLVQVVTIHKAKGLQYPLVFLPFICSFRPVDGKRPPVTWHDADGRLQTRWTPEPGDLDRADRERLAEDLRLLYVAVTRARHHCWLGIAPVRRGSGRDNQLHLSAVGYLLAGGEPIPDGGLRDALQAMAGGEPGIQVIAAPEATGAAVAPQAGQARGVVARQPLRAAREHWWIASYSALRTGGLSEQGAPAITDAADTALEDRFAEAADEPFPEDIANAGAATGGLHRFPRGPGPGTFLHGLLEWAAREGFDAVAGDPGLLRDTVARRCRRRGWDHWVEPLSEWLGRLLTDPLQLPGSGTPLRLRDLATYQPELEFWFETRWVDAQRLDRAVCALTLGAAPRPEVLPQLLNGMLKGFIDLVFAVDGRYYTLDYKSNWLGPLAADYAPARMRERVLESRYDLQYVLYSLALHRLLQARLPGYDYDRHVGGTVTWFLRGLDAPSRGLHLERPPRELIEGLDAMVRSAPDADGEVTR